ncbi:pancreatic secretory granule membrane major glycoprotein GP2-like [Leptodactylus fuscus]|uniref:pancreatic secretory granule membrane major glycoprotein GP2-like n=1 Tax=Leptodactylus fuscus TaxID=238119 RepID=UPI003F4E9B5C
MKLLNIIILVVALKYAESTCSGNSFEECSACGGSCDTGPCICADSSTVCVPTGGECNTGSNECCPSGLYYDATNVCCTDTPLCNPSCAGDQICKNTTCQCNSTIYQGKTINDLKPSLVCGPDVMTVSLSRCLLTYLKYNYSTIQLINNSAACLPGLYQTKVNNTLIDNFDLTLKSGWCGNTITNDSTLVYISNTIHIDILKSPIISANPISFNITCAYNKSMQISLSYSIHPVVINASIPGLNGNGLFDLTMAAFWDDQYSSPIQQSETVTVGTNFYLGLFVLYADGNKLVLRVDTCIASPVNNRNDPSSVVFVRGGCAVNGDINSVVEQNGQTLEARIKVSTFKFQASDFVFIFCDVRMCDKSTDCSTCDSSKSGRSSSGTTEVMLQVPFQDNSYSSSVTHSALPWTVLCSTLLGLLSKKLY